MRVFIGGVMQASHQTKELWDQGYRAEITQILRARWPDVEIIDPRVLHPESVEYGDEQARETLFNMAELAGRADVLVAYLPTASMGTALEMYQAYQSGVPVLVITPMTENWVVRAMARRTFKDLAAFAAYVQGCASLDA